MALNFSDSQVKKVILNDSTSLTLSEILAITEFKEILEEAIRIEHLLNETYSFTFKETEKIIYLPGDETAILNSSGILKIPTINGEYVEISCTADNIFDFLKKVNFSYMYAATEEEKVYITSKDSITLNNFICFIYRTQEKYLLKKNHMTFF